MPPCPQLPRCEPSPVITLVKLLRGHGWPMRGMSHRLAGLARSGPDSGSAVGCRSASWPDNPPGRRRVDNEQASRPDGAPDELAAAVRAGAGSRPATPSPQAASPLGHSLTSRRALQRSCHCGVPGTRRGPAEPAGCLSRRGRQRRPRPLPEPAMQPLPGTGTGPARRRTPVAMPLPGSCLNAATTVSAAARAPRK
jgi:hypothetical protein